MASPGPWPWHYLKKAFRGLHDIPEVFSIFACLLLFGCKLLVPCVLLYIHNRIFKIQPVCREDSIYLRGLGHLRLKVLVRRPWPAVPGLKALETALGMVTLT